MDYCQADRPLAEQDKAEGHAVRAVYLYSGMADVAAETGDERMLRQCEMLWENYCQQTDVCDREHRVSGLWRAVHHRL